MIFEALQSELFEFNMHALSLKILKITEVNPRNLNHLNFHFFSFETLFPLSPLWQNWNKIFDLYEKFVGECPPMRTPTQKFRNGFSMFGSQEMGSS